jgi:hypothetical protein
VFSSVEIVPRLGLIARFEFHPIDATGIDIATVAAFRDPMGSSHFLDQNGA